VALKRGTLRLVSTTEELLGRESSGSGLEIREYDRRDQSQKLALTSPSSGCRSVGIVRWRTTAASEFSSLAPRVKHSTEAGTD
jgi:hypothetical protein